MAKGKVKEALDAAASFKARGIKRAALKVVADFEAKKQAAPPDPNQPPIQRDEPAAQADPPVPAPEAQPVQPVAPAPEPVEEEEPEEVEVEESQEAKVARWREELESTHNDYDLITAVLEFFEAENADLDDYGVKVTDGYFAGSANIEGVTREGYVVCKSDDDAEAAAIAQVQQDLDQEPELFNQDWLENYIDTEKLSDSLYDDVYNWVYEEPKSYGWDPDDVYETDDDGNYLDDEGNIVEDTDTPPDEWIEAKAREQVADPMEFLGNMYGKDELLKEAIRIAGINIEEAATDAVAADGWQHFLSRYDGNSYDLPSGGVYFRD